MKTVLCILSAVLLNRGLYAQTVKDTAMQSYLKKNGYVPLTDMADLPKSIVAYFPAIIDGLAKVYHPSNAFYVLIKSVHNGAANLNFLIFPISGIKLIKDQEDKDKRLMEEDLKRDDTVVGIDGVSTKMKVQHIDDFGGSVGELLVLLNKATRKITF